MGFELTTQVVIDTDCTDSYKSNYHTITTKKSLLTGVLNDVADEDIVDHWYTSTQMIMRQVNIKENSVEPLCDRGASV